MATDLRMVLTVSKSCLNFKIRGGGGRGRRKGRKRNDRDRMWPAKPKIFFVWSFMENVY